MLFFGVTLIYFSTFYQILLLNPGIQKVWHWQSER